MKYLFQVSLENTDGTVTIPADKVFRWKRQIATSYADLSEKEKDSDRKQAQRVLDSLAVLNKGINNMPPINSAQQMSLDKPDYGLFTKPFEKMTEQEISILLEQYKITLICQIKSVKDVNRRILFY